LESTTEGVRWSAFKDNLYGQHRAGKAEQDLRICKENPDAAAALAELTEKRRAEAERKKKIEEKEKKEEAARAAREEAEEQRSPKKKRKTEWATVGIKTESDGGWTAEFQPLREKAYDDQEYRRLHALFFAERHKEAGARESRTRGGRLRVTTRIVGTTTRIAEWPRLRDTVLELHEAGNQEEALRHLRCLEHYMMRVRPGVLPRALRVDSSANGFADEEVVELLDSDEDQATPEAIDMETYLLGPQQVGRVSIKQEELEPQAATAAELGRG
jgi:hypothetical protein